VGGAVVGMKWRYFGVPLQAQRILEHNQKKERKRREREIKEKKRRM